ncbi:hypothetical protein HAX54_023723, partial [Datura stramonium]|nr:hypothetical protein [Datura stramonium]
NRIPQKLSLLTFGSFPPSGFRSIPENDVSSLEEEDGVVTVTIEERDIHQQLKEWETTLIGYVVGDVPYEKQMKTYVTGESTNINQPAELNVTDKRVDDEEVLDVINSINKFAECSKITDGDDTCLDELDMRVTVEGLIAIIVLAT